jgi:hypothetical protein
MRNPDTGEIVNLAGAIRSPAKEDHHMERRIKRIAATALGSLALCAGLMTAAEAQGRGGGGGGGGGFRGGSFQARPIATGNAATAWGQNGYYGLNNRPGVGVAYRGVLPNSYGYGRVGYLNGYGARIAALNGNGLGNRIAAANGNGSYYGYGGAWGQNGYYGVGGNTYGRLGRNFGRFGGAYGGYGGYGGYADGGLAGVAYGGVPTYGVAGSTNCNVTQSTYYDDHGYTSSQRVRTCY